jgi:hypothetical protein
VKRLIALILVAGLFVTMGLGCGTDTSGKKSTGATKTEETKKTGG